MRSSHFDIVLINPPGYSGVSRRGPYELSSLNILLKKNGFTSTVLDIQELVGTGAFDFPEGFKKSISKTLEKVSATIFFITIRTTAAPWAINIANEIRQKYEASIIVFYAPRIEELIFRVMEKCAFFDILCKGRPHDIILALANCINNNYFNIGALHSIPNIWYKDSLGKVNSTIQIRDTKEQLQEMEEDIWVSHDQTMTAIHIGKGCPHHCTFCSVGRMESREIWYHSPEYIVALAQKAFDIIKKPDFPFVMLENENLLSNRGLLSNIYKEYQAQGSTFNWGCYGRVDDIDDLQLEILVKTKCKFIFLGIESGSQNIQRRINKRLDINRVVPTVNALSKNGILSHCTFIFGFYEETIAEIGMTLELMAKIYWAGSSIDINPVRIEPNTIVEMEAQKSGNVLMPNSSLYKDLQVAGYNPEDFDYEIGYRMYSIKHTEYDINDLSIRIESFVFVLKKYPVSVFLILHILKVKVLDFISDLTKFINKNQFQPISESDIFVLFSQNLKSENLCLYDFGRELFSFEIFKLSKDESLLSNISVNPKYSIDRYYQICVSNPYLLPTLFPELAENLNSSILSECI